jgi:hypothetical protein
MTTKPEEDDDEGLFSKLKRGARGLIMEEDAGAADKPAPTQKPSPAATVAAPPLPPTAALSGVFPPDPKIRAILEKDVQIAAAPALTALDQMCSNLVTVLPEEGQRIKAGLAAIKSHNPAHTLDAVLTDVDECLVALDKKSRENTEAVQAAIQKRVGAREAAIAEIEKSVADKKAQIVRLNSEIAEIESRRASETAAIATERAEIDRTNASFAATADAFRAELVAKKQKITAFGKGA